MAIIYNACYNVYISGKRGACMDTVTINVELPKDVLLAADISEVSAPTEIRKLLALYLFKERLLSFGKASELAGIDKLAFMELAGSKGISLNYDVDDFQEDLMTLRSLDL
jgi:predicted HTH domain antitoxin